MEIINVYIKTPLIKKWLFEEQVDLVSIYKFVNHDTLNSLKNELDIKTSISIAIIDTEINDYKLYVNSYFIKYPNIRFIGIGFKKDVHQIIEIINSNIISYISIENTAFELLRAINHVKKGKVFLCSETRDHLINNYIALAKSGNVKIDFKHSLIKDNIKNEQQIQALTEREKKVANLLSQGLSYKEIASILEVTTSAINQNSKNIFRKLNVRSRAELSFRVLG